MSYDALAWARNQNTGSGNSKNVLKALAHRADEHGVCWPSNKRLASDTDLSVPSVERHLARLEDMGFITRTVVRFGPDGGAIRRIRMNFDPEKVEAFLASQRPAPPKPSRSRAPRSLQPDGTSPADSGPINERSRSPQPDGQVPSSWGGLNLQGISNESSPVAPEGGEHARLDDDGKGEGEPCSTPSPDSSAAQFDQLLNAYPHDGHAWDDVKGAEQIFANLGPSDRALAVRAAAAYARFVAERRETPFRLHRWLRKGIFRNHAKAAVAATAAPPPTLVAPPDRSGQTFVREGSSLWDDWARAIRAGLVPGRRVPPAAIHTHLGAAGAWFPTPIPPAPSAGAPAH